MSKIKNPVIPGMAPDPSIIRVDDDYYIATSTFHWNPAVQIFHSKDLANWKLMGYALTNNEIDLKGTSTPAGVWAPHLSYDTTTKKFWLAYSHMVNMSGREFNSDSYAMYADSIEGPWSKPIYLTSIGFDPSIFHDEDGKHYVSILEWETRIGYQAPGQIVIAEFDLPSGKIISDWHRVTGGFTTRGCAEAPQIYKRNNFYYLLIAAGGTGYAHGVEIGRSKNIFGPFEPDPSNEPIITSNPRHIYSLGDSDAGHFEMYNPNSVIQKSGHGSLVQTRDDEWYIAHLMARPLPNTTLNPLGRETSIQKMEWSDDDWIRMADGSNLAKSEFDGPIATSNSIQKENNFDINDQFTNENYDKRFMTPYQTQTKNWVHINDNQLRIYGGNSFFSQINPSIMATRVTSFKYSLETKVKFVPDHYSESAGLGLYYDSNNWIYARLCQADTEDGVVLRVLQAKLGERTDMVYEEVPVLDNCATIRINYNLGNIQIQYKLSSQNNWHDLGSITDVSYLSDEGVNGAPGEIGGFTGLFNFIGAIDAHQHDSFANFEYYKVTNK